MEAKFQLDDPSKMQATMKITMRLDEWEELQAQLEQKWPSWELSRAISSLVFQAKKTFYQKIDSKESSLV